MSGSAPPGNVGARGPLTLPIAARWIPSLSPRGEGGSATIPSPFGEKKGPAVAERRREGEGATRIAIAIVLPTTVAACSGIQSALDPAGPGTRAFGGIWWLFFWISAAVFLLVLVALVWAMLHRRAAPIAPPTAHPEPAAERRIARVVGGAVALTVAILVALTMVSYGVAHQLFAENGDGAATIELVGHQWWWEVRYHAAEPSQSFVTANEIHLPVGETVRVVLRSDDVIHSFWVPNLAGKKDLVPGQTNILYLAADRPGVFRSQCAEFCGLQHAHMALFVVAEPKARFDEWLAQQRQPAREPTTDEAKRGRQVFLSGSCMMCHAVAGTTAGAVTGPDLTHVASRLSLGAGRLPNSRGHRAGWIADAPTQKPGTLMPPTALPPADFQALLAYIDTLE